VLVRLERTAGDTQIWLARTTTFPQQPMTIRARAQDAIDRASPFAAENHLGRHLVHANVVVAREAIEIGPWSCAITPGAPGIPLPELHDALAALRTTNLAQWTEIVTHIVVSLLDALDAAHRTTTAPDHPKGIVHGGVRPELALVAPDGAVRLTGFGVRVEDDASRIVDRSADTLAYVAPEQLGSRARTSAMDLWSVGAVLHELVDGRRFRGDVADARELYRIALTGAVAAPQHAAPAALEQARAALVAKNPRDRPRTAADAVALLSKGSAAAIARLGELVRARMPDDAPPPRAEAPPPAAGPDLSQIGPSFVPPMVPAEEGTVSIDPIELAAMRASIRSGRTPVAEVAAPPATIAEEDAPMMRRRSSPGAATPTPTPAPAPAPAAPRSTATPPPTLHLPPPPPLDPQPSPPAAPIRDAAPLRRAPPTRFDFDPRVEGTSMTIREVRRAKRSFAVIIAVAAVIAIVVGVVAGVMIAGDDTADAKAPTVAPTKPDDKPAPEPSGPVLHPRAP